MVAWTCGACGTHNEPDSRTCAVCGAETPAREDGPDPGAPRRPGPGDATGAPPRRGLGRPPNWVAAAVMVLILLAAVAVRYANTRPSDSGRDTTQPATTTYHPTTTSPTPRTATTTAGPSRLVAIEQPGGRADEVASMFETYFRGINAHHPVQAMSVVVPTARMDASKPTDVADFGRAIATTRDEDIRLGAVRDDESTVTAEVAFRSRQNPGYGPAGSPDETCTDWTMHYTLADERDGLRIKSVDARHRSC